MKLLISYACLSVFCLNYSTAIYQINSTKIRSSENPAIWTENQEIWGPLLEDWALAPKNSREKRVMKLPPTNDAYVLEETNDNSTTRDVKESKISPGKITNTNSANYPMKKPPGRQVSETDLYLLGAIEKLVYRVDFMEKRLRKVEEMLYYVTAGNRIDHQDPCKDGFTRVSSKCYYFANMAGREYDWKVASKQCKKMGGILAEFETLEEYKDIISFIQTNEYLRGKDFWTSGLNPGLLWIWSNSAKPVVAPGNTDKKNPSSGILGDGRCLRLAYNPALRNYAYKGTDCSVRYQFICEVPETTSSNEITRLGRSLNIFKDEL